MLRNDESNAWIERHETKVSEEASSEHSAKPSNSYLNFLVADQARDNLRFPGLEEINGRFARALRTDLFSHIHRTIDVRFHDVRFVKYKNYLADIPVASCINLAVLKAQRGIALISIETKLIRVAIDCLFGGVGKNFSSNVQFEFSQVEQRINRRLLEIIFLCLTRAADPTIKFEFDFVRTEFNREVINVSDPDDMYIVSSFEITIAETSGVMEFCLPWKALETMRSVLTAKSYVDFEDKDERWTKQLSDQIRGVEVELVASFGKKSISVSEMLALKPGDVIALPYKNKIEIEIEGNCVIEGRMGTMNDHYAVEVEKRLNQSTTGLIDLL